MINIQQELSNLDKVLTDIIKSTIKNKGLVDTGKLYNSISVKSQYTTSGISLDIIAEDYFEFVDSKYGIMDVALKDPKWDRALNDTIEKIIESKIENILK